MARMDGWSDRLMQVVERHSAAQYQPGRFDCFTLACDVVEALTGARPYAEIRYTSDAGAVRVMRRCGFACLGDAMAAVLPHRPAGHAQRGDIAVIATGSKAGDTLGIVVGDTILVRIDNTMTRHPLHAARLLLAVG